MSSAEKNMGPKMTKTTSHSELLLKLVLPLDFQLHKQKIPFGLSKFGQSSNWLQQMRL